jgi:hypothetical protein
MKIFKAANNEATGDFTHMAIFDYNDIANNATSSNQVTIAQIPAGGSVELAYVYEKTELAGATDITLDVGTTAADPLEFIKDLDVDGLGGSAAYNTGESFTTTEGAANKLILAGTSSAAVDVLAEWNGTVASLTAGEVVIGLRILDPARFAK